MALMQPTMPPTFQDRFVRSLPGDPDRRNIPRPVSDACYSHVTPTAVPEPRLLAWSSEVGQQVGAQPDPEWTEVLAGNRILDGMVPYSACYGGHQFGSWAGQLGDGRAITLGEVATAEGTLELQLKGAGPTPYSRHADGRAVLRSSVREFVCSEAMFHLGVPTTRALSLVSTGAAVVRDMFYDGHPRMEPGAIVCRVAPSFLRFGSYEIHASWGQVDTLRRLVDFTVEHHFPELGPPSPEAAVRMFTEVCRRTAVLMAHWLRVGFVHGVLNTDNMSILGLTIDYGPYGWIEPLDMDWTPNTTDAHGRRYRFGAQPDIGAWNLSRLGEALHVVAPDTAALQRALKVYVETFNGTWSGMLRQKFGLHDASVENQPLVNQFFELCAGTEIDMTLFFRALSEQQPDSRDTRVREALYDPSAEPRVMEWVRAWAERTEGDAATRQSRMNTVNPLVVPRNWQVQVAIDAAEQGDTTPLDDLMRVLRTPYADTAEARAYAVKRPEWARDRAGCSMLSCSS